MATCASYVSKSTHSLSLSLSLCISHFHPPSSSFSLFFTLSPWHGQQPPCTKSCIPTVQYIALPLVSFPHSFFLSLFLSILWEHLDWYELSLVLLFDEAGWLAGFIGIRNFGEIVDSHLQWDQMMESKVAQIFQQVGPKVGMQLFIKSDGFKIAPKVKKYFGYFCNENLLPKTF